MELNIAKYASECINTIEDAGFEAYCVGGAVRDLLLGSPVSDYDIATNATPEDIIALFDKVLKTGILHGTVTVVTKYGNIEVTTYRTDGSYTDKRHPDKVNFLSSIEDDLGRRDFTVNAMAYNPKTGLIDPYFGRKDLKNRILRAVGEPQLRFREDALRILRLFRFACKLGFEIEENTLKAAINESKGLLAVSSERIFAELKGALCSPNPERLSIPCNEGILNFLGIYSGKLEVLKDIPNDISMRFFTFLYETDAPKDTLDILKADNKLKADCNSFTLFMECDLPENEISARKMLRKFGEKIALKGLLLKKMLLNDNTETAEKLVANCIKNKDTYTQDRLAINGDDLKKLGLSGKEIGKTLNELLDAVINDQNLNKKETLISLIKQ